MPHYVTKPNHRSLKYQVYSTISDEFITEKMYRADMLAWLEKNGYTGWTDPAPLIKRPDLLEYYSTPAMVETLKKESSMQYWNGSFWYVTEEDGYFI